jgi:hypothetical protein
MKHTLAKLALASLPVFAGRKAAMKLQRPNTDLSLVTMGGLS